MVVQEQARRTVPYVSLQCGVQLGVGDGQQLYLTGSSFSDAPHIAPLSFLTLNTSLAPWTHELYLLVKWDALLLG